MVTAYLGLGSNLGDRRGNLQAAVGLLEEPDGGIRVLRASRIYETEPWGLADQPKFLNCAVEISTALKPGPLLRRAKELEALLGRETGPRYGPRAIDIDILLYGDLTMDAPDLQIPHPRLHQRAFALAPLGELAAAVVHPVLGLTIAQLEARVNGKEGVVALPGPLTLGGSGHG